MAEEHFLFFFYEITNLYSSIKSWEMINFTSIFFGSYLEILWIYSNHKTLITQDMGGILTTITTRRINKTNNQIYKEIKNCEETE